MEGTVCFVPRSPTMILILTQSPNVQHICLIVASIIAKRLCFVNHGKAINKNNRGRIEEILSKCGRQNDIFRVIMALWT